MFEKEYGKWKFMNLYITDIGSTLSEKHGLTPATLCTTINVSASHGKDSPAQQPEAALREGCSRQTRAPQTARSELCPEEARQEERGLSPVSDLESDNEVVPVTRTRKSTANKTRRTGRSKVNTTCFDSDPESKDGEIQKRKKRKTRAEVEAKERDIGSDQDDKDTFNSGGDDCSDEQDQDEDSGCKGTDRQQRLRGRTAKQACRTLSKLVQIDGRLDKQSLLEVKLKGAYKDDSDSETEQDTLTGMRKNKSDPDFDSENEFWKNKCKGLNTRTGPERTPRKGRNRGAKDRKTPKEKRTRVKMLHTCVFCEKVLRCKAALDRHLLSHTGEKPHHCDECGRNYCSKMGLKIHQQSHTGKMDFICNDCGKQFTHLTYLRRHIYSHTDKELRPHRCPECGKYFIQKSHVDRHRLIHFGKKPYCCKQCDASFNWAKCLRLHVLEHLPPDQGGEGVRRTEAPAPRPEKEKKHACPVCEKKFTTFRYLQIHMKVHTVERPYACQLCSQTFSQRGRLESHVRTHGQADTPSSASSVASPSDPATAEGPSVEDAQSDLRPAEDSTAGLTVNEA